MPLKPEDRSRGNAERAARHIIERVERIRTIGAPIRPETRDALLAAVVSLPAAPTKAAK